MVKLLQNSLEEGFENQVFWSRSKLERFQKGSPESFQDEYLEIAKNAEIEQKNRFAKAFYKFFRRDS